MHTSLYFSATLKCTHRNIVILLLCSLSRQNSFTSNRTLSPQNSIGSGAEYKPNNLTGSPDHNKTSPDENEDEDPDAIDETVSIRYLSSIIGGWLSQVVCPWLDFMGSRYKF